MKKLILVFAVGAFLFTSCGGYSEAEGKAADKLCSCLEGMDMDDPSSAMGAAGCMMEIANDEELEKASESGVKNAMKEKCPDEAKVFDELTNKE